MYLAQTRAAPLQLISEALDFKENNEEWW
jgi:hypothetical protein